MENTENPPTSRGKLKGIARWIDTRLGLAQLAYPIPSHANSVLYTLGGITAFGILVLFATGVYLTQFYHPDPGQARQSVIYIVRFATLGDFVRSLHFWMANLVTITLMLHALRVFTMGSYRAPRELNWLVGVGLLAIMVGFLFTGSVLRWDQEGWEALQHNEAIGKMLGSFGVWFTQSFTTSTPILDRLFIAHVSILPVLLLILMAVHFFQIKLHGISSLPGDDEERPEERTDTEQAIKREGYVLFTRHALHILGWGLLMTALGGILALMYSAPVGVEIQPGIEVTKPAWMFLPLYPLEDWIGIEALLWGPIIALAGLALIPLIDRFGSSAVHRRWTLILAGALVLLFLAGLGAYAELSPPVKHIGKMMGG